MSTTAEGIEELEGQTIHVGHRQHRHHRNIGGHGNIIHTEVDVRRDVAAGQHNTLGRAGRTRRIVDDHQLVNLIVSDLQVILLYPLRIGLLVEFIELLEDLLVLLVGHIERRIILNIDGSDQVRHLLRIQIGPFARLGEEHAALRVMRQILQTLVRKVGQDRYYHCVIRGHRKEGHCPVSRVRARKCNLITLLDAQLFEDQMQTSKLFSYLCRGKRCTSIITQCGFLPITTQTRLKNSQEMFHRVVYLIFIVK